jgi:integrase
MTVQTSPLSETTHIATQEEFIDREVRRLKNLIETWPSPEQIEQARQKQALDYLAKALPRLQQEQPSTGITLSEYLDDWVARYKTRTGSDYKSLIKNYIKPGLGHYKLTELDRDIIQSWIDEVKSVKKIGFDGQPLDLSSVTRRHIIRCLHKALNDAVPGKLDHNPADRVIVHRDEDEDDEAEVNPLTEEEDAILQVATHIPSYDIIMAARWTGKRRGELVKLRGADYGHDRDGKPILTIGGSYDEKKHRRKSTKNKRCHIIQLWPQADEVIKRRVSLLDKPDGYLFPGKIPGRPVHPSTVSHDFSDDLKLLGLPHHRFHDLRHTFACWLFNHEDWNLTDVQQYLGHKDPMTTLRTYLAHIIPKRQRQLIDQSLAKASVSTTDFMPKKEVARLEGFEPTTLGSEDRCSIH